MFRNIFGSFLAVVIAAVVTVGAWAGEKVPLDKLPEPVTKAIKERFPNGMMLSAEKETDDGKVRYEVKVKDDGKKYEVEVTPEGEIVEVELEDD